MAVVWFDGMNVHQRDAATKLRGAVQHHLGLDSADRYVVDDELRAQCGPLGIDPDQLIPRQVQRITAEDYELWPEHALAWNVYLGCGTQWVKTRGFGGPLCGRA